MDDREDMYRSRGQQPRRRPSPDDNLPPGRPNRRPPQDDDAPRGRAPRRYDDDRDPRYDRAGSGSRHDQPRPPRPGRGADDRYSQSYPGRSARRDSGEYGAQPRPSRSYGAEPGRSSGRGQRPPDRSMRGQRPPLRDDEWEPRGPRPGGRGMSPADSGARMRRPAPGRARVGLWEDDEMLGGRGLNGASNRRDLRARGSAGEDEDETGSAAAGFLKAVGMIIFALALGVGAAFGYYKFSTPQLHVPSTQSAAPSASPTSAPAASPTKSPTGVRYTPAPVALTSTATLFVY